MRDVDATAYLAPYPQRRVRRPVRLALTEHSYPLEPWVEESWLAVAFRAFARLAGRSRIRDLLIVGTGNGLDALGAAEIFDLRSLAVTDLFEESLAVSRENILSHLESQGEPELSFHAGDLLSCVPAPARFDLVYENLPNIPATAEVALELGINSGRFFRATKLSVPAPFADHLLALHHRCLREAWRHVRPGGGVLTAIGGRMPDDVVFDLHRACGYLPELVAFDVKLQGEPDLVLPGYRRVEDERGLEFTFYASEAADIVAERRRSGLDGQQLVDTVAPDLRRLSMSAREAERRSRRGEQVAHSVLMIFGWRYGENDPS
jgi:methylase of polypeptide subunit release factors